MSGENKKESLEKGLFATAINCIDGRTQLPLISWIKKEFQVDFGDMITEPGFVRLLSLDKGEVSEGLREKIEISLKKHNSRLIIVAAHHDCAGNPVDKNTQLEQLKDAVELIKSWNLSAEVLGVWINENWEPVRVTD